MDYIHGFINYDLYIWFYDLYIERKTGDFEDLPFLWPHLKGGLNFMMVLYHIQCIACMFVILCHLICVHIYIYIHTFSL